MILRTTQVVLGGTTPNTTYTLVGHIIGMFCMFMK